MTKQFRLTDEEMTEMQEIAHTPIIKIGDYVPDIQEMANDFWKKIAKKYDFFWDTVRSAGTGDNKDILADVADPNNQNDI